MLPPIHSFPATWQKWRWRIPLATEWRLLPHDREHYHTAMLPVAYDRAATALRFGLFLEKFFMLIGLSPTGS